MVFYNFLWQCPQSYNKFKEYDVSNFKIFNVMKFMSKSKISLVLLSIIFTNKFWSSQLDMLYLRINTTIELTMRPFLV